MSKGQIKPAEVDVSKLDPRVVEVLGPELAASATFVKRLALTKFFGKVTLEMQSGIVCIVRSEQVMKPSEL